MDPGIELMSLFVVAFVTKLEPVYYVTHTAFQQMKVTMAEIRWFDHLNETTLSVLFMY